VPCDVCVVYTYLRGVLDTFGGSPDTAVGRLAQAVADLSADLIRATARIDAAGIP